MGSPNEVPPISASSRDNGKEHENYYNILGLYRDYGKGNGNYYNMMGLYRDNGKEMETTTVCHSENQGSGDALGQYRSLPQRGRRGEEVCKVLSP